MNCPYCGTKLRESAKFCYRCGQAIIQQEVTASENEQQSVAEYYPAPSQDVRVRRGVSKKLVIGGVFACVAIVAAVILIIVMTGKSNNNYLLRQDQLSVISKKTDNGNNLQIVNKDGNIISQDNVSAFRTLVSLDGNTCMVFDEDAAYYYRNGELNRVDTKSRGYASMSADGSTVVAVLSDHQYDYLYLYPDEGNRLIESIKINNCSISPSGEYLCANVEDDYGNTEYYLINTKTNNNTRLDIKGTVNNISDTGKTIFFSDSDSGTFSVWNDGKVLPLTGSDYTLSTCQYNVDNTQMVYTYADNTYLYDAKTGKTKISNLKASVLRPSRTQVFALSEESFDYNIGLRDFRDVYLFSNDEHTLQYLDGNHKAYDVATNVESAILTDDGKRIVYQSISKDIYRIDGSSESGRNKAKIDPERFGSAEKISVSASGNRIYMLKSNGDLYCNDELIDSGVEKESFYSGQIFDGENLIYIKAGQAYVCDGSASYKINGLESEYVKSVFGEAFYPMIIVESSAKTGGKIRTYYYIQSHLVEGN